jgi:hypothetical protein
VTITSPAGESGPAPGEPDSRTCVLVVAAYADAAPPVELGAGQAADRIMMSPALGDFIVPRFAPLGKAPAAPSGPGGHAAAAARLADELTSPGQAVGAIFFALVIADPSAAAVTSLAEACRANPVLAQLRLRYIGLADVEDRDDGGAAGSPGPAPWLTVSPDGGRSSREIADEVVSYAEDLLRYFATAPEPGFSPDGLMLLRRSLTASRPASAPHLADAGPLDPGPLDAGEAPAPAPEAGGELPDAPPAGLHPPPVRTAPPPPTSGAVPPVTAPPVTAPPARPADSLRRAARRAGAWRPGRAAGPDPGGGVPIAGPAPVPALAFLVLTCLDSAAARSSLSRGRELLRQIDKQLAADAAVSYWVRALQGTADTAASTCQPAGQLSRGRLRTRGAHDDFAQTLAEVRRLLDRDGQAVTRSAGAVPRAAVVIVALDAPVADASSVRLHEELRQDGLVIWVALGQARALLSGAFTDGMPPPLSDAPDLADEVARMLTGYVTTAAPDGAAVPGPGSPADVPEH